MKMSTLNKQIAIPNFQSPESLAIRRFLRSIGETKANIIEKNKNLIILETQNGKRYCLAINGNKYQQINMIQTNQQKIKCTCVKVSNRKTPNFKKTKTKCGTMLVKTGAIIFTSGVLAVAAILFGSSQRAEKNEPISISIENIEDIESIVKTNENIKNTKTSNETSITKEIRENSVSEIQPEILVQTVEIGFTQQPTMVKREETDQLFHEDIEFYSKRYGVPYAIASALFSQERANNDFGNIGRITKNVCGEKIVVPIIQKSESDIQENREEDKMYIILDEPVRSSYENDEEYKLALEKYKMQLETSKTLKEEGYKIYTYSEIKSDYHKNINVSLAYLVHGVYKCDMNCNKGLRAYNGGYTIVNKSSELDITNGTIEIGDPLYNQHVFSYLYPDELSLTWKLKDFKTKEEVLIIMDIQNTMEVINEQENGHNL